MAQNADKKIHPQGGSTPVKEGGAGERESAAKHQPPASVQPVPPEEPRLEGGSKPEQHRGLEENVHGQGHRHPESTAAQHATGSYTGDPANKK